MKNLTQEDYEKFYEDIMEYVRNGVVSYWMQGVMFNRPPSPSWFLNRTKDKIKEEYSENPKSEEEYNIEHEISLSERNYGRYIDDNFKLAIIRAMMSDDEHRIDELKRDVAYIISCGQSYDMY